MSAGWNIVPRDPLVLRQGRVEPPLLPGVGRALPLPGTLAGAVRAKFYDPTLHGPDDGRRLVNEVSVRGPWLVRQDSGTVFVPAPVHVRLVGAGSTREVRYARPMQARPSEGFYRPKSARPWFRGLEWSLSPAEHKTGAPEEFLPLGSALDLLLGTATTVPARDESLYATEGRVHVAIDPERQTATPAALYSTGGTRYADDVAIGLEVAAPSSRHATPEGPVWLGGEGRLSHWTKGTGFPAFPRSAYEAAVKAPRAVPPGLLLMLVTPASFSTTEDDHGDGWIPPWLSGGSGQHASLAQSFSLQSVAMTRFVPASGWNLAGRDAAHPQGRQRAVRRLVPHGTVYFLTQRGATNDPAAWLEACEHFWGAMIDVSTRGRPESALAAPSRDGYGMVIPGLWYDTEGDRR